MTQRQYFRIVNLSLLYFILFKIIILFIQEMSKNLPIVFY